jgi:hypothetical protein
VRSWCIEIHCGESPQLDDCNWPDEREEQELDWLASAVPSLYAQMLPLPADSPDELVGRTFSFAQSPNDEPADWDRGVGWLFFGVYLFEHDLVDPATVAFTERQEPRQLGDPSFQRVEDVQEGGLSLGRDGVPERFRDWRVRAHTADTTRLLYKMVAAVNGYG